MAATATAPTNGSKSSKFVPGFAPETIALKFSVGTPVHSQFGGDQVLFQLTNGQKWYADLYVAQKIERMGLQHNEPFEVCKTETRRGNQRIVEVQISAVVSPEGPVSVPQAALAGPPLRNKTLSNGSISPPPPPAPPMNGNGETSKDLLARCYRDAVDVCLATLAYAKAKGLVMAPDFGDVRALAATICINETGRR